ncbi:hypothetical protein AJ79_06358 [Helicocarpus griseus UAMH5409]|uniref:chitinase n=1 Tax=Helicocarpus griseus UAMH5409 TaxID=1447875 RepID=A0A2B7XDU4_9EURO|nr:hypothetical protein AJ79_06358 [Helicocarpus griseus UAMH5409]
MAVLLLLLAVVYQGMTSPYSIRIPIFARHSSRVNTSAALLGPFAPEPSPDGSCATYTIASGDSCYALAGAYDLTIEELNSFNENTWAWNGCDLLFVDTIICLSSGTPPIPAPVSNAVCGPQVPGTAPPASGGDISGLNPCPLNACCNIWGQCGITEEFCIDTSTGAPGTAEPGSHGCISNCGTDIISSSAPEAFRKIADFEGYNLQWPCLHMDVSQTDSSFTHIQFAFATLTSDYQVVVSGSNDPYLAYEFEVFKGLKGVKRIVSFGGWAFSTDPSTYMIFRQGVTPENRQTLATNIANFIKSNGLDGVDIDWEYPGAPDIPGIPAGSPQGGLNYLEFLKDLRELLDDGMSLSLAVPASYWYLKAFPIDRISEVVDYIVFMTYDLHGLWDVGNAHSQEGCAAGNCLRRHINSTETERAMSMITKIVMGVTSYGRSFQMVDAGCTGPECTTEGNPNLGRCTATAGYLGDGEIQEIMA